MYRLELIPTPARIQLRLQNAIEEHRLNRNKLVNDCLATLIYWDQRGQLQTQTGLNPLSMTIRMASDSSKPRLLKIRKDLVDYMEMQRWNKSGAINRAIEFGLKEIASGARLSSNYQLSKRQHYMRYSFSPTKKKIEERSDITPAWSYAKCIVKNEYAGAQICGFCTNYNDCGKFCYLDLKPKTRLDWCSRFKVTDSTKFINCVNCKFLNGRCDLGITPNPHSHNCQQFYPAP